MSDTVRVVQGDDGKPLIEHVVTDRMPVMRARAMIRAMEIQIEQSRKMLDAAATLRLHLSEAVNQAENETRAEGQGDVTP